MTVVHCADSEIAAAWASTRTMEGRPPCLYVAPSLWAVWDGVRLNMGRNDSTRPLPPVLLEASPALARHLGADPLPEPSLAESAASLARDLRRWAAAGFRIASAEVIAQRRAACASCDLWEGDSRLGLGTCRHPGCNCTRLKLWLATTQPAGEHCKWRA